MEKHVSSSPVGINVFLQTLNRFQLFLQSSITWTCIHHVYVQCIGYVPLGIKNLFHASWKSLIDTALSLDENVG